VSVGAIANPAACGPAGYPFLPPVNKMTTGYYDPLSAPSGKCDHGTLAQAISTCFALSASLNQVQGISKDSPCASYPLGPNHFTAASLAQQETLNFVQSIVADLNTANNMQGFCALLDLQSNTPICSGSVVLTANPSWVAAGATVTFSVVVGSFSGSGALPTGTAAITDETGNTVCTVTLTSTATGTCTYVYPTTAAHSYTAAYSVGNANPAVNSAPINTAPYTTASISYPSKAANFIGVGINSSGDVVGYLCSIPNNDCSVGNALYHNGQFIDLNPALNSGDTVFHVTGMAESGSIVGVANNTIAGKVDAYLLNKTNSSPITYTSAAISAPESFLPRGLNSSEDVVGQFPCSPPGGGCNDQNVLYHNGQFINLNPVLNSSDSGFSVAGIANSGSMVGVAGNSVTFINDAYLLNKTSSNPMTYTATAILAPEGFAAYGVNSSEDVVGRLCPNPNGGCNEQNVIYHKEQFINLNPVLNSGDYNFGVFGIAESGSILGGAQNSITGYLVYYLLAAPYVPTFSLVATVAGLNGTLGLQNNMGSVISLTATGASTIAVFPAIASGSSYSITVASQPSKQTCSVSNGSGFVSGALVTNVSVTCN
jgi:hypothetical protein